MGTWIVKWSICAGLQQGQIQDRLLWNTTQYVLLVWFITTLSSAFQPISCLNSTCFFYCIYLLAAYENLMRDSSKGLTKDTQQYTSPCKSWFCTQKQSTLFHVMAISYFFLFSSKHLKLIIYPTSTQNSPDSEDKSFNLMHFLFYSRALPPVLHTIWICVHLGYFFKASFPSYCTICR